MRSSKNISPQAWLVCLCASLFFFYEFVQMSMFNAITPHLIHDFHTTPAHIGTLSATYFYANVLFMFPAGMLLDRYSTKKMIIGAMILCVSGTLIFSFTRHLGLAMICRFLTGIGGSFPFLSCLKLASRWFPPQRMALISGLFVTIAMFGGMIAQTPLTLLVVHLGWHHAVLIDGLLGLVLTLIITLFVQDYPKHYDQRLSQAKRAQSLKQSILQTLSNRHNWSLGLYTAMLNLPIFLLAQLWGSLYLTQVRHLSVTQASYLNSAIFIGTIVGCPLLGWLSDQMERRKPVMVAGALASLICILLIMFLAHLSLGALLALFFALGFFTSSQIISYPMISEHTSLHQAGAALGLASVLIMSGGAIFEPLFGSLLEWHWLPSYEGTTAIYTQNNFLHAFAIMPIAFVIGLAMVFISKETFCRRQHEESL